MSSLAQSLEDVTTAKPLKGDADAFALLGELNTLHHHLVGLTDKRCHGTSRHLEALGHQVTAKDLKHPAQFVATEQTATAN